jgi:hypothetical protein
MKQEQDFIDKLVQVYEHLLQPASSEGTILPWVREVTERVQEQLEHAPKETLDK